MIVHGDARHIPLADESVHCHHIALSAMLWYDGHMKKPRGEDGRFLPGQHASPETEFKPGQHWRPRKPYWDAEWLREEYVTKEQSASEIAERFDITEGAILFWLKKHNIPARSTGEVRAIKHWGLSGEVNGMYGVRGEAHPNWKGGITPERQACYSSIEWAEASRIVWKRDKGRCTRCGKKASGRHMHLHHIIPFDVAGPARTDPDNIVLLCAKCHSLAHPRNRNTAGQYVPARKEVKRGG